MFFSGLGFAELLGQQMAFLPDPCGFVPAPEAPTSIGVVNIVAVLADELPVFWACGVTPQSVVMEARPEFCITHSPGKMLVTDLLDRDLAFS